MELVYNDASILLTTAIADNDLVAVKSVKEALEIPPGEDELCLIYAEGAEGKVILRKCIKADIYHHKGATNTLHLKLQTARPEAQFELLTRFI